MFAKLADRLTRSSKEDEAAGAARGDRPAGRHPDLRPANREQRRRLWDRPLRHPPAAGRRPRAGRGDLRRQPAAAPRLARPPRDRRHHRRGPAQGQWPRVLLPRHPDDVQPLLHDRPQEWLSPPHRRGSGLRHGRGAAPRPAERRDRRLARRPGVGDPDRSRSSSSGRSPRTCGTAVIAAGAALVVLGVLRLLRKETLRFLLYAAIAVAVAAFFALRSGRAEDAFLPGMIQTAAVGLVFAVTNLDPVAAVRVPHRGRRPGALRGDQPAQGVVEEAAHPRTPSPSPGPRPTRPPSASC